MKDKIGIDALFLYATEGILVADDKGDIQLINPSANKLFGYNEGELIGEKIEKLVPTRFSHSHTKDRKNYIHNPHARSMGVGRVLFGLKKDGTEFPVEISLSPYSLNEKKFVIAFIVDITVRKQSEEHLKNYNTELEKQVKNRTLILEEAIDELEKTKQNLKIALEKERELNELKSRFVSMASHEFRTPLTTMLSSLSLLNKYGEQNDRLNQIKHVGKIKTSIHNLTDILNDFLSVSRLEEGKIETMSVQVNLREVIADIINEMQSMAAEGQTILQKHTGNDLVNIDVRLLKNILFNLISNALKFTLDGLPVEVISETTSEAIKISIKDKGIGISNQDQKHLFERFFRGRNATHIQGTGLGLHIVAKYAEILNATLSFESIESRGSTFIITIPQQS